MALPCCFPEVRSGQCVVVINFINTASASNVSVKGKNNEDNKAVTWIKPVARGYSDVKQRLHGITESNVTASRRSSNGVAAAAAAHFAMASGVNE